MDRLPMKAHPIVIAALCAWPLAAHTGEPLRPHDLAMAWEFDPGVLFPLLLSACLYARGARRVRGVSTAQMTCFWAGWSVLALALISPLHPLGEVLFSAHMAQHEILILVAAPLLVLSRPLVPFLWALPPDWRREIAGWTKSPLLQRSWRAVTGAFAAWTIHAIVLWAWHAPVLFQATLTSDWVHAAQHASFLFSALLFWWSLLYARGLKGYGVAVLSIFTTSIHTSILGALLTFSSTVWYPAYAATASGWGLSPLEDQQIGGLIMWIPAGVIYVATGLAFFAGWLRESDTRLPDHGYAQ